MGLKLPSEEEEFAAPTERAIRVVQTARVKRMSRIVCCDSEVMDEIEAIDLQKAPNFKRKL
jgi:uncharacterized hydantoinase/oxoprolinase family protein